MLCSYILVVSLRRNTNIELTYREILRNLFSRLLFKKIVNDNTRSAITAVSENESRLRSRKNKMLRSTDSTTAYNRPFGLTWVVSTLCNSFYLIAAY